ncbi:hypothetical protein EDD18DRAFT_1394090 [Armillaria luteobubalina]|uniref:Uncharacterized protein n=1 Tax=Armillaria luteobubalina TaxID=153913 RepID=A0AA39Q5J6_9AGAR|nr:hypothetical protein EDD18DRAFT_1394090 [Armillaria luteobubalina]
MAGLASPVQFLSPRRWTTSPTAPVHPEEVSPSWVWVEELLSPRDCASDVNYQQQNYRHLPPQHQQQIPPDVHEKLERNRQLRHMLEEAKKANTLIQRDISILEATLRELSESVLAPPEYGSQYPTYRSIWSLMPDEVLYGNGLISPFIPPLVHHDSRHAPPSSLPGWPRLNTPPHGGSFAQIHVSPPQPESQVRAESVDMFYHQTQPPPPATISPQSVTPQEHVGMRSPQVQDLSSQALATRTPPLATISSDNVGLLSPQRHEAQGLPTPNTAKYTIPPFRQGHQVISAQLPARPSSPSPNERPRERRPHASHKRHLAQTTEPRMTITLLLERPEMQNRIPEDWRGLENPRLGDPASLWCRYHAFYIRQIALPRGIRRTSRGLPVYNDVVGWRAIVCLRPPRGIHLEDSAAQPYVMFTEVLMSLFSKDGVYGAISRRLRLECNENGVLSGYKGPFIFDNHQKMVEEVAKHLNDCGVTFHFAKRYILGFIMEMKRQREQG